MFQTSPLRDVFAHFKPIQASYLASANSCWNWVVSQLSWSHLTPTTSPTTIITDRMAATDTNATGEAEPSPATNEFGNSFSTAAKFGSWIYVSCRDFFLGVLLRWSHPWCCQTSWFARIGRSACRSHTPRPARSLDGPRACLEKRCCCSRTPRWEK